MRAMKHQQKQISLLGCAVKISYGAEVIILIRMGVLKYSLNFIAIGILYSKKIQMLLSRATLKGCMTKSILMNSTQINCIFIEIENRSHKSHH